MRKIKIVYPIQSYLTIELETDKTDEELIEFMESNQGDDLLNALYELEEQPDFIGSLPEDESYDDRNSTFLYDDNDKLIFELNPNQNV